MKNTFVSLLFLLFLFCSVLRAASIYVEYEGEKIILFESKGASYYELHRLISKFSGSTDKIEAYPPGGINIKFHDTNWSELMSILYDKKVYHIIESPSGGLIVTRRK